MAHKESDNSFVMVRPKNPDDGLRIDSFVSHEKEQAIQKLYGDSFSKYFLDIDGAIPVKIHKEIMRQIMPTVALIIFSEFPDETDAMTKTFMETAKKNQIDRFNLFSDRESGFFYILLEKLSEMKVSIKKSGLEATVIKYPDFFEFMRSVYFKLPSIYIFNLIDAAGF